MPSGGDDEIAVRLRVVAGGFKAGLDGAAQEVEKAGGVMATGMKGATEKAESLFGVLVKGKEGRHIRLMAQELGTLAGAGTETGKVMFGLVSAGQAMQVGLTTLTGGVGLAIAAVGLAITGYMAWTEHTKKQTEEQLKLNEATREFHAASLKTVDQMRDWLAAGRELPAWLGQTAAGLERAHKAQTEMRRQDIVQQVAELNAKMAQGGADALKYAAQINALNLDLLFLTRTGLTFTEWMARQEQAEKNLAAATALRARMTLSAVQADQNAIEMLGRFDAENQRVADNIRNNWESMSKGIASSLVNAANSHENFLSTIAKQLEEWGERMLAQKALQLFLTILFPELGAGAMIGGAGLSTGALNFAGTLGLNKMRGGTQGAR